MRAPTGEDGEDPWAPWTSLEAQTQLCRQVRAPSSMALRVGSRFTQLTGAALSLASEKFQRWASAFVRALMGQSAFFMIMWGF